MILSYKPISVQIQQKRHQNNVHERCSSLSTVEFVGNKATGQISKRVLQENEERQIFQKTNISYPLVRIRMCVSGSKKYSIKFGMLYFLVTLVLRFTFCLITDELNKPEVKGHRSKWMLFWLFYLLDLS